MNQLLLDGEYSKVEFHHVRMAFSSEIQEVGSFKWKKIFHLVAVFFTIVFARFRTGAQVLYYPPASPNMVPFLRDCVLLIGTRWLFRKTVFHFHANGLADLYIRLPWFLRLAFRAAYQNPDLSVVISSCGRRDAEFLKTKNIALIPNGIPDTRAIDLPKCSATHGHPEILFCGMVSEEKGVGILLETCVKLKQRGAFFQCKIVGKAASEIEEKRFIEFIKDYQLEDMVEFTGPLYGDKKWKAYAESDIFCFPTFYSAEAHPLVAIEAMMCNLPVVASNWRGLPDIVVDGETGYLVPPKDSETTASRLQLLLENLSLRERMGQAGRTRYEKQFTIDKFRHRMEEVLSLEV